MEWNGIGTTRHGNAAPVLNQRSPALQIGVVHSRMVNRAVSPLCSYMQHTFPVYSCVPIALLNAMDANSQGTHNFCALRIYSIIENE